jgi:hypothetical protein
MSREKIQVPGRAYEEIVALQREIHFTSDHEDTIKKAEDRGYMAAANWIRQNERAYKIGFAWGFEPVADEPQGMLQDIQEPRSPPVKRTIAKPMQTMEPRSSKKAGGSKSASAKSPGGFCAKVRTWLGKYF